MRNEQVACSTTEQIIELLAPVRGRRAPKPRAAPSCASKRLRCCSMVKRRCQLGRVPRQVLQPNRYLDESVVQVTSAFRHPAKVQCESSSAGSEVKANAASRNRVAPAISPRSRGISASSTSAGW